MIHDVALGVVNGLLDPYRMPASHENTEAGRAAAIAEWGAAVRHLDQQYYPDEHQRPASLESAIDRTQIIPISHGQQQ
jgi:hypothetical protein